LETDVLDRVFINRYRLVEKIGIGGMAEVYKAIDEVLGRTVAVKVMLPQYASDPTFAARFKQEAQAAANLQSPYIVNIYDWSHESADNVYFIVMEYVRGTDLKTAIQQRGAINQRKVAEIGSQVCAALSVAHSYDIIHRDIKPHNIMVQPDGNAKVMDFGIARASGSSMTQTGSVLGTAYYVSPEQAQGKPLTPATDLYSLGVVLYEAATGRVPFDAPDAVAVALKQVNEQPIPPTRLNPSIDSAFEAIILRAMAKNPLERYTTAEQMRTALNNYLAGRSIDAGIEQSAAATRVMGAAGNLPVIGTDGAQPPTHTAIMPSVGTSQAPLSVRSSSRAKEEEKRKKRQTGIIIAIIIALLCVVGIGIAIYYITTSTPDKVAIPNVANLPEQGARDALRDAGLTVKETRPESHPTIEKGYAIATDPPYSTQVDKNTGVVLIVSRGPAEPGQVTVPDLSNKLPDEARAELEALKLKFERAGERYDPDIEEGKVCGQMPAASEKIREGETVKIYVSRGKEKNTVPDVTGQPKAQAEQYLKDAGFEIAYAEAEYSDKPVDEVIWQSPPSGIQADRGTTITLRLSLGPEPINVPDLSGYTYDQAVNAIQDLGLKIRREDRPTDQVSQLDKVVAQDPAPDAKLYKNETVTVYIGIRATTQP
jgi:serine/threonine-protein kinase